MNSATHKTLAKYLVNKYLHSESKVKQLAFQIGCISPDKNPATYLKCTLHFGWMKGHHWPNTQPYIIRMLNHLERKVHLTLSDYYKLGRLIHYICDAFTNVHNITFPTNLRKHRKYEHHLHKYFTAHLGSATPTEPAAASTLSSQLLMHHRNYLAVAPSLYWDSAYIFNICCLILSGFENAMDTQTLENNNNS